LQRNPEVPAGVAPLLRVELRAVIERHRHEPRVRVHGDEREPVLPLWGSRRGFGGSESRLATAERKKQNTAATRGADPAPAYTPRTPSRRRARSMSRVDSGRTRTFSSDADVRASGTHLHAVPREVYAQSRFRELRRHLLRRQLHLPGPVRVAVEAQVFLIGVAARPESVDVCGREGRGQRRDPTARGVPGNILKPARRGARRGARGTHPR
jgi:hypothetical protein